MKKALCTLSVIILVSSFNLVFAQKTHLTNSFGISAAPNFSYLHLQNTSKSFSTLNLNSGEIGGQIDFIYERDMLKWLSLRSGIGISMRGTGLVNSMTAINRKNYIFNATLPLSVQFKTGKVFWFEAGIELSSPFANIEVNLPLSYQDMDFQVISLSALSGFQVNLTSKLSIVAHVVWGLTPHARITEVPGNNGLIPEFENNYFIRSFSFGLKYMFSSKRYL